MLARLLPVVLAVPAVAIPAPAAFATTPEIHAHRGGPVVQGKPRFGEETRGAFRNAARHGFVLEVDSKLTEDGVPVAVHDATVDRTTNCSGEVRTFTLAELRGCRTDVLGSPGSGLPTRAAPRPARILTVRQVLVFAKRTGAQVNLEIKNVPTDSDFDSSTAFANRVMDAVIASGIPRRQLIIQAFLAASLDVARQRLPGVRTSLLAVQAINELYLQTADDEDYTFISPESPVSADYVRRAHAARLDVAPFTLNRRADVRAARSAGVDAVITDDPLMAARALGMRPPRFFSATAFIRGSRLIATGDLLTPRGVTARQGCRGTVTMRVMAGDRRARSVSGRLNRNCEFLFGTRTPPARLGRPSVTIRFNGNRRVLPRLVGPRRARLAPPSFRP